MSESPGGGSSWASFFMLFAYFVYIAHLTKFTRGSSLILGKYLPTEKSKVEESPWSRIPSRKGKQSFMKATGTGWSSVLGSWFRTKKSPSNQNLSYIKLKTRFPFIFTSTSHDTKSLTIASNCNCESWVTILCLASQHIFRFFHFCRGVFLCH